MFLRGLSSIFCPGQERKKEPLKRRNEVFVVDEIKYLSYRTQVLIFLLYFQIARKLNSNVTIPRTGEVAQVVELLPSKYEALS
jgi:hypothetical protein